MATTSDQAGAQPAWRLNAKPENPHPKRGTGAGFLALALLGLQLATGLALQEERQAGWVILPPVPSEQHLLLRAMGDRQLAYRIAALQLQEAGDGGGVLTPLVRYDYDLLEQWLDRVDQIDPGATHVMVMASYYFTLATDHAKVRKMVEFIARAFERNPEERWRFLAHAAFIARHRLEDRDLALAIAERLATLDMDGLPYWVRQMPAFVLADLGESEAAADFMAMMLRDVPDLPEAERRVMIDFIEHHRRPGLPDAGLRRRKP